jgi:DNA-binding HxlR family transcriptional regulator
LYADEAMRTLQMKRDLPGISQKVLTQQLRELVSDLVVERIDFNEKPLRVEYRLSPLGRELMPVLIAARAFSVQHAAGSDTLA